MTLTHISKNPPATFKADRFDIRIGQPHVFWFQADPMTNWGVFLLAPGDSVIDENGVLIHSLPEDYKLPDVTSVFI